MDFILKVVSISVMNDTAFNRKQSDLMCTETDPVTGLNVGISCSKRQTRAAGGSPYGTES
jgi:hypothetical protein